jgi:hypothetical protein
VANSAGGRASAGWGELESRQALSREVGRLAERLRGLSDTKLAGALPPYPSRAAAGRAVAQLLADSAVGVAERRAPAPPVWREVPELNPFAVGDQIAVTGHDLWMALAGVTGDELVWTTEGRRTTGQVVTRALDALRRLRLAL